MKLKHLLLFFFIFPFIAFGQTLFGPQTEIVGLEASLKNPGSAYSADLDGDGDMDLLCLSSADDKIVWFENEDGMGRFGNPKIISNTLNIPRSVSAADLDLDGDLDMIFAADDKIGWYENENGLGNFNPAQIISTDASSTRLVRLSDLDGDGDLDLLSASSEDSKIAWYENEDGFGTFGAQQIIDSSTAFVYAIFIEVNDVDGDGDMDVLSAIGEESKIVWYENEDGNGGFGTAQIIAADAFGAFSINATDLDGDGDLDLVSANTGDYEIVWYENEDGNGTYGDANLISTQEISNIYARDMDADGDIDIVSVTTSDLINWYENEDGAGNFGQEHIISTLSEAPNYLHFSDLDADGDVDIITAYLDDKLVWYENEGLNQDYETYHIITMKAKDVSLSQLADMDGDGDLDAVSSLGYDSGLIIWNENLDGVFGPARLVNIQEERELNDLVVFDIDADGDLDIIASGGDDNNLFWLENLDGLANFGNAQIIDDDLEGHVYLSAADLDGDGDGDIAMVTQISGNVDKIVWYENTNGMGVFGVEQVIAADIINAFFIGAADLDGDTDIDLICGSVVGSNGISWVENIDGQGTFSAPQLIIANFNSVESVFPTDIDGDGDTDIVAVSNNLNAIAWLENSNNTGLFIYNAISTDLIDGFSSVFASDLDDDDDQDILFTSHNDDKLGWYENLNGTGDFGEEQSISNNIDYPLSVFAGDIDGDGDEDVLSASYFDHKIAWYENLVNNPSVSGFCFYDQNENKIKDANEFGLFNQNVLVDPGAIISFTNADGEYNFIVDNGNYVVEVQPDAYWTLTTDSSSYNVIVDNAGVANLNFGLIPTQDVSVVNTSITSAPTRCGFQVPFWLNYENQGTTFNSGQITLELDPLASFISAQPMPDDVQMNVLYWNYEDLPPSHHKEIELVLEMPGVDNIGETVAFISTAYIENDQGDLDENSNYEYTSVINCAYDPNDKQVRPAGVQEENFTLFGEDLEYTIRFQNTGTDTAFTVRLEDVLDSDLDWNSFRSIAASHAYVVTLDEQNGLLEFLFENILLPDSTTNEVASHGFVKYRIKALDNLPEETVINNTADIFFDFNPAIQTNTTLNTLVSELPVGINETEFIVSVDVFPNPFGDFTKIEIGELPGIDSAILNILDINGRVVQSHEVRSNFDLFINGEKLPSGMYFYKLKNRTGMLMGSGKIIKQF